MATKQTSIFNSFILTAAGIVTLGLITMYFGYYRVRIQSYEQYIAELQSLPTPEIALSYSVAELTVPAETKPLVDDSTMQKDQKEEPPNSESKQGESGSNVQQKSEKTKRNDTGEKPSEKASGKKVRTRPARKQKNGPDANGQSVQRGPAFPKTSSNPANESMGSDSPDDEVVEPPQIPDIDDPELDDNPLIRALREASQRQAENPDAGQNEDPPQNPFEAILNIQDN